MAKITVEVVTPEKWIAKRDVDEVIVPGAEGLFGVRPGHLAMLSLLQKGTLTLKEGAAEERIEITGGFAQVGPTAVRILADGIA